MMPIGRKVDFDVDWEAAAYWRKRCLASEAFIAVLPDVEYYGDRACLKDAPDITEGQWQAYQAWQELVKEAECSRQPTEPKEPDERQGRCDKCCSRCVLIRGRHPGEDKRSICPTCAQEQLDDLLAVRGSAKLSPDDKRAV